jgi:hypothetical protein
MTFSLNIQDKERKVSSQLLQAMKIHSLSTHKLNSALLTERGLVHDMQSL